MKLSPEQIEQNGEAVKAHQRGEKVEYRDHYTFEWHPTGPSPLWEFNEVTYRPAPKPEPPKPWDCADDVPGPVCWIRMHGNDFFPAMVIGFSVSGPKTHYDSKRERCIFTWEGMDQNQHSTDRKTWLPCVKTQ